MPRLLRARREKIDASLPGIDAFFDGHQCNAICKHLGLKHPKPDQAVATGGTLVAGPQRQPNVVLPTHKPVNDFESVEGVARTIAIIGAVLLTWKLFTSGITIDIWSLAGLLMFFCGVSFYALSDKETRASDDHCGTWSIMSAFISGAMLLIWKFFTSGIAINDFWSILGVLLILSVWVISDHYDKKVPKRRKSS